MDECKKLKLRMDELHKKDDAVKKEILKCYKTHDEFSIVNVGRAAYDQGVSAMGYIPNLIRDHKHLVDILEVHEDAYLKKECKRFEVFNLQFNDDHTEERYERS